MEILIPVNGIYLQRRGTRGNLRKLESRTPMGIGGMGEIILKLGSQKLKLSVHVRTPHYNTDEGFY